MMRCIVTLAVLCLGIAASLPTNFSSSSFDGFDLTVAERAAWYSKAAYCDASTLPNWNCPCCNNPNIAGFKTAAVLTNTTTDMHGFVGVSTSSQWIVVSFRGTHDLDNFITDLKFFKCDLPFPAAGPNAKVHSGFFGGYMSLRPTVVNTVASLLRQYPSYTLVVTGHSLGAALATICAADLMANHGYSVVLYTPGSPRVGNADFASYMVRSLRVSYRMTHWRDIVVHLPLEDMGFKHLSTEVFQQEKFSGSGSLKVCDASGEDPTCADQFDVALSVDDHLSYLDTTFPC